MDNAFIYYKRLVPEFDGRQAQAIAVPRTLIKYPFGMNVEDQGDGYLVNLEYLPRLAAADPAACVLQVLGTVAADPAVCLADLAILSPDREQALVDLAGTAKDFDTPASLDAWFRSAAAGRPDAAAVCDPEGTLSYGDLDAAADRVASNLRKLTSGPAVAVAMHRSRHLVAVILGELRAGMCYVPIDPAAPPERARHIVGQFDDLLLVSGRAALAAVDSICRVDSSEVLSEIDDRAERAPAPAEDRDCSNHSRSTWRSPVLSRVKVLKVLQMMSPRAWVICPTPRRLPGGARHRQSFLDVPRPAAFEGSWPPDSRILSSRRPALRADLRPELRPDRLSRRLAVARAACWPRLDWFVVSNPSDPPPPVRPASPSTSSSATGRDGRSSGPGGRLSRLQRAAVIDLLRIAPVADELGRTFARAGHELHLVGGSVRDALLGRLGDDLDFTTDARPAQIQQLVSGWGEATWDTGIDFGTIGVAKAGLRLEITTFRSDLYDGDSRNPVVTFGDSLAGDLQRRDFAVNAMAVSLPGHEFTDPFGGLQQLGAKILDTPATPEESFRDDPLRMLRAARFVSQLSFVPAPRVVTAMTKMASEIDRITAERVGAELVKLIMGGNPRAGLALLTETGLADRVLPELPALRLEQDEHHEHKDVYEHSLTVLDQAIAQETGGADLTLRLAALLHDIGKPATRRFEPGGGVSFHHHEVVGEKLVRKRLRELRLPKALIDDVAMLTCLHLRFHGYGTGAWTDSAVRRYVTDAGELLPRLHKLVRADCTTRNPNRRKALQRSYDDLEERIARITAAEDLARVRPDLDGNAIMELLGVPPGPVVGRAWSYLKELRLEQGPLDRDAAESALLEWARREGITPPDPDS